MGWASGSQLAEEVWQLVKKYMPQKDHQRVAEKLLDMFENHDADDPVTGKGTLWNTAGRDEE